MDASTQQRTTPARFLQVGGRLVNLSGPWTDINLHHPTKGGDDAVRFTCGASNPQYYLEFTGPDAEMIRTNINNIVQLVQLTLGKESSTPLAKGAGSTQPKP
jgi:hypothetical protein